VKVRVLSPAIEEIAQAALWFDSQRAGLGSEFWREAEEMLAQIAENPLRFGKSEFATAEFDVRLAVIRRFKYVIHFAIDVDEVQVAAVAHAARKPGYWLRRVKK
jgi:hypothetical protein